jgi:hypothetical protein
VLIVRVHDLVPRARWRVDLRYPQPAEDLSSIVIE